MNVLVALHSALDDSDSKVKITYPNVSACGWDSGVSYIGRRCWQFCFFCWDVDKSFLMIFIVKLKMLNTLVKSKIQVIFSIKKFLRFFVQYHQTQTEAENKGKFLLLLDQQKSTCKHALTA